MTENKARNVAKRCKTRHINFHLNLIATLNDPLLPFSWHSMVNQGVVMSFFLHILH